MDGALSLVPNSQTIFANANSAIMFYCQGASGRRSEYPIKGHNA